MPLQTKLFLLLVLIALVANSQFAAPLKDSLVSETLREKRNIEIFLPSLYTTDTAHYDVWYAVAGEWDNKISTDIFSYLVAMGFRPPVITVRVPNRYVNGFNLGNYPLRVEYLSKNANDPPINFGLYYSENGQDDWWRNPVVRW